MISYVHEILINILSTLLEKKKNPYEFKEYGHPAQILSNPYIFAAVA